VIPICFSTVTRAESHYVVEMDENSNMSGGVVRTTGAKEAKDVASDDWMLDCT